MRIDDGSGSSESLSAQTGEELLRTMETIPHIDGEDLGEVVIDDAFGGTPEDRFPLRVWHDGERAGTFDYRITCPEDNRFTLGVEDRPFSSDTGDPVEYVDRWCAG